MKGKKLSVDESIRIEAYLLSEKAGHPHGMEHYFWEEAKAIVESRAKVVATAVKKAAAKPKPKAAAKKPPAATKPKAAKKPALNGANGKDRQLSLDGGMTAPARNRPLKK